MARITIAEQKMSGFLSRGEVGESGERGVEML